jgi:hypothetical protein
MSTGACSSLTVVASESPIVQLISPGDEGWLTEANVSLIYNITDQNGDVSNTTLYINNITNQTNSTAISLGLYNNFSLNLSDGQYNWTVRGTDQQNNMHTPSERTFYVDTQDPNITLIYPYNESSISASEVNLSFNVTDNLDSVLSCDVVLDGNTIHSGANANNAEITNLSSGTLSNGIHYWNVTCTDESTRQFTSDTWNFTISDTPPTLSLVLPLNEDVDDDGNISFVFFPEDDFGFLNCSLILDDVLDTTNQTIVTSGINNTINKTGLSEGTYNWTVLCYDTGENSVQPSVRNISVDLNSPTIELNLPSNETTVNYSDIDFNFTVTDIIDSTLDCDFYVNNSIVDAGFAVNSGELTNKKIENLTDGFI